MNIRARLNRLEGAVAARQVKKAGPSAKDRLFEKLQDLAARLSPEGLGDLQRRSIAALLAGYMYLPLSANEREDVSLEMCRRADISPAALEAAATGDAEDMATVRVTSALSALLAK